METPPFYNGEGSVLIAQGISDALPKVQTIRSPLLA
jgi:hypothetical protein